jgi:hypothetical protein
MTNTTTPPASPSPSTGRRWSPWPPPQPSDPNAPSAWLKWAEQVPGFEIEGSWGGTFTGKHGPCGKVTRADGRELRFSLPVVLERRVEGLPIGAVVKLVYFGLKPGKEDKAFHAFDVLVDLDSSTELQALAWDPEIPF